jgi:CBS domain-containing membrane protein
MDMAKKSNTNVTVKELMTKSPATLDQNETLDLAEDIMHLGRIRHMPVLEDGKLVGIISQRDLFRSALITALGFGRKTSRTLIKSIRIKEIMTRKVVAIGPDVNIKIAARQMTEKQIGCLPVLDDGHLIGIITESDILRYVAES